MNENNSQTKARYAELYNDIPCGKDEDTGDGILKICRTKTTKKNLEPSDADYLSECEDEKSQTCFTVPKGNYYLIQDFVIGEDAVVFENNKPIEKMIDAAKTLWLEFLWQDKEPADDIIYVRLFTHEGPGIVFQLLRKIKD